MTRKLIMITIMMIASNFVLLKSQTFVLDTSQMNYKMSKMMGKDIFEANGVPYLQPTVEVMNVTSNARFYDKAFIPRKVKRPYFKFGLHGMYGFVPDEKTTYSPQLPVEQLTTESMELNFSTGEFKYGSIEYDYLNPANSKFVIKDTAGLVYAVLKGMLYDGLKNKSITVPKTAPTGVGTGKQGFNLPSDTLRKLFQNLSLDLPFLGNTKLYDFLPQNLKDSFDSLFTSFPQFFNLPEGANLSTFYAFVPQLEIGSLFGTELLIRFIPPVDMGKDIGKFAFWGVGLKHSISQYFNESDEPEQRYFDLAIQVVYQGTTLENRIGVTNADLKAEATMMNFNIHASKNIKGWFDVYSGLSYESIKITSDYKYYLPIEMQWQLGLPSKIDGKDNKVNADPAPQRAKIELSDAAMKWNIGLYREFGPVSVFADFNVSKMFMFSGGLIYTF